MVITTETLRKIRAVYRLSLEEMGLLIGVSRSHLCRIEKGERQLSARLKQNVIEALELTESKLTRILQIYNDFSVRQ
jgi:transcriptional regulator with XRE-family HTH domain